MRLLESRLINSPLLEVGSPTVFSHPLLDRTTVFGKSVLSEPPSWSFEISAMSLSARLTVALYFDRIPTCSLLHLQPREAGS